MAMKNYYASIVVVEIHANERITIESISVSKNECVLSGAWNLLLTEKQKVSNIISGKLIIALGDEALTKKILSKEGLKFLDLKSFLKEAGKAAHDAIAAYEVFKSEDLKKRKNMVEPSFFDWPETLNLNDSAEYLESLGDKLQTKSLIWIDEDWPIDIEFHEVGDQDSGGRLEIWVYYHNARLVAIDNTEQLESFYYGL